MNRDVWLAVLGMFLAMLLCTAGIAGTTAIVIGVAILMGF